MDSCFSFHSPGEAGQGVKDDLRPPSELLREVQKAAELAKRCQVAAESAGSLRARSGSVHPGRA